MKSIYSLACALLCVSYSHSQLSGSGSTVQYNGGDYLSITDNGSLDLQNTFTIEAWVYVTDATNNTIIDKGDYNYLFQTHPNGNTGLGLYNNTMGWKYSSGTIPTSEWCHVAVTFDQPGNDVRFYLNGTLLSSHSGITNPTLDNGDVNIGRQSPLTCSCNLMDGYIEELKVWNSVRSQTDIRGDMCQKVTASHAQYANLISYWKFDDNTGTTTTDSKGSNNATFVGTPTWATSGAPIGDNSTYSYGSGNGTNVTQVHADGSSFNVNTFTGTPDGVHVYVVNEAPNTTTAPSGITALETTRYYGVWPVGGTSPTYSCVYDYTGNSNVNGQADESDYRIIQRNNNADGTWTIASYSSDQNRHQNTIGLCSASGQKEFIAGDESAGKAQGFGSGYCATFDGSGDYITVNNSATMEHDDGTYECWIRPNWVPGTKGANPCVMSMRDGIGGNTRYSIHIEDGMANLGLYNGVTWLTVPYSFTQGNWYHLAFVDSGTNTEVIINGTSVGFTGNAVNTGVTGKQFKIGFAEPAYSGESWLGEIDEVRIWNSARTIHEIRDFMCKKVSADECNLVAYYRFDENGGAPKDYVSSNDGTFVGNTTSNVLSSAPIGDDATWAASVSTSSSLNLAHTNGDDMTATMTAGTANLMVVYRVDEQPNTTTPPGSFDQLSQVDYFGVKLFGSSGGTYTATYNYDGHPGISNEANLGLASRSSNSVTSWTEETGATLNQVANTLTLTGQTGTEFILGSTSNNSLPVELIDFNARLTPSSEVVLSWTTNVEINNDFFTVQKSQDVQEWTDVILIEGAGNSSEINTYSTKDIHPFSGISFYRLVQTDFDGTQHFSDIVSVQRVESATLNILPNPASSILNIYSTESDLNQFAIVDITGNDLTEKIEIIERSKDKCTINISTLPDGVYFIRTPNATDKIIKQ